jgi:hypothetical protein
LSWETRASLGRSIRESQGADLPGFLVLVRALIVVIVVVGLVIVLVEIVVFIEIFVVDVVEGEPAHGTSGAYEETGSVEAFGGGAAGVEYVDQK